ncbi:MAG: diguanylate cyclase [Sulfurospirillaceae bacterium]|nr:diguanylate cyclase [Sulfurospirillaceae bacterium]
MKKSTSLINSLTIKILFIFLFFAIVSGIIIIYNQNLDLKKRSDAIHTSLLKDAKQLLQDEIARALGFIDSEYKEADLRVKKELEDEMKSFLGYLSSAYEFLNKKDDLLSIYALLDEHKTPSCKNINFTIFNKDGTPIFHDKKLEEDAIEEMSNGVFSKIEQADEWLINHAIKGENVEKKLSKIAKFDPLDWFVVGTIDLTLFEKEVKEHIFRQLAQWRFGVHGLNYFFVNSFDGDLIFSNGVYHENPLNVWEAEGENIGYISKQNSLIAQNEKEGGFNIYSWKNLDNKSVEKISFIKKIPNEEMFIGAGIDMNIVKKSALKQSNILKNMIEKRIYWLISLFTLAAILTYIFMFILAGRIKKTLNVFIKVFEKAATEQVNIDEKSVIYSEFKPLAISVNKMIIALKEQQKKIFHNANHDYLTALPNRLLLSDRLEHAILHAKRLKTRIAVMFLDLDFFKRINDSLGHEAGDMVLKSVSSRLLGVIRESDTLARFGGDEFVLIVPYIENDEFVYELIKRILEAINRPFYIDGKNISIGCSIGVAFYPEDGEGADILIKNADIAMYEAKQKGRNTFQLFNSKMDEKYMSF